METALPHVDNTPCSNIKLPLTITEGINGEKLINASFSMYVMNEEEEGLYNFFFHSCPNYNYETQSLVNFTVCNEILIIILSSQYLNKLIIVFLDANNRS